MIVLSRKRILMVTGTLMIAIFSFMFQNANVKKTVPTVALPVTNKVIVIDAGH